MTSLVGMTPEQASGFARLALGHVTREYPNKLDHVLAGPEDARTPRALHPIFYGSFDWHSCVHAWWMLAHILRRFPAIPEAPAIRALFDSHLTPANINAEAAYLDRPTARGFERPYGWAWFLMLAAELRSHAPLSAPWSSALAPLTQRFIARFLAFLPLATYPIRAGVHTNTAFAVRLALEYPDEALRAALTAAARRWYADDRDCQAWEPGGDEFLSPALIEAECLRAILPEPEFHAWFSAFLPRLARREPRTLFVPATVSDRSDGKIAHLDGLNLSRAWCWRSLAPFTPEPAVARAAAEAHIATSLPHVGGDYMGEHWLASFAALALG
ncbi:MAG TPA: DUF2891 domain-containing protein [Rhodopila sp.]|uniref:DUF2891 domain-containing protein n=1 Tax=Rhodopila sp. TaxID=2480087 RepID=UPI002C2DCCC9|nr:DUF2891 domain-containing protein [Rhodopila sp.]HVY18368.1 DUF2891 domain-containing protein [Rhodopila sp.]